ncbi:uncharacterized protein V6R79_025368 [Siganus canaliculatus]
MNTFTATQEKKGWRQKVNNENELDVRKRLQNEGWCRVDGTETSHRTETSQNYQNARVSRISRAKNIFLSNGLLSVICRVSLEFGEIGRRKNRNVKFRHKCTNAQMR